MCLCESESLCMNVCVSECVLTVSVCLCERCVYVSEGE